MAPRTARSFAVAWRNVFRWHLGSPRSCTSCRTQRNRLNKRSPLRRPSGCPPPSHARRAQMEGETEVAPVSQDLFPWRLARQLLDLSRPVLPQRLLRDRHASSRLAARGRDEQQFASLAFAENAPRACSSHTTCRRKHANPWGTHLNPSAHAVISGLCLNQSHTSVETHKHTFRLD